MKILGLVGSQRKDGNSYLILKEALENCNEEAEIIQLAEMRIDWCNACRLCKDTMKCVIEDDVGFILDKISGADAAVFSVPRYLPIPSIFMALIERIGALYHYKLETDPDSSLPLEGKPFGLIVVSAVVEDRWKTGFGGPKGSSLPSHSLLAHETHYNRLLPISWSFGSRRGAQRGFRGQEGN